MKRILIMGLPGAGKTTLAEALVSKLDAFWFNADEVRTMYSDWDFSEEGRVRQAYRMRSLADSEIEKGNTVICDFVAPTKQIRDIFDADFTVWVDTIDISRYADTNKIFEAPGHYDIRVTEQNSEAWAEVIVNQLHENNKSNFHRQMQ
jgi:adenylylsulfate kinase